MNRAVTLGGQRLLRHWVTHPLYTSSDLDLRRGAVRDLLLLDHDHGGQGEDDDGFSVIEQSKNHTSETGKGDRKSTFDGTKIRNLLKKVPDLERLLQRVHSNGVKRQGPHRDHPDARAVMFESGVYTARKIRDFADVLQGFDLVVQVCMIARVIE